MQVLKKETLVTRVRPYATLIGTSFTKEYHDSLHSVLPEGETEYPHSIHFQAVLADVRDPDSEVVGFIAAGVAWVSRTQSGLFFFGWLQLLTKSLTG